MYRAGQGVSGAGGRAVQQGAIPRAIPPRPLVRGDHAPWQRSPLGRSRSLATGDYRVLRCSQSVTEAFRTEEAAGGVTEQTRFSLALLLYQSSTEANVAAAVQHLRLLLARDDSGDGPSHKRDYLLYLGKAFLKLEDYGAARKYINQLLEAEPNNAQALELKRTVDKRLTKGRALRRGATSTSAAHTRMWLLAMS